MSIKKALPQLALLVTGFSAPAFADVNYVRVCNYRAEQVWTAYAVQLPSGEYKSNGWYNLKPSECRDLLQRYHGMFWFYAEGDSGWTSTHAFGEDDVVLAGAAICVHDTQAFTNLDRRVCQGASATSGYMDKIGHRFDFLFHSFNVYEIGLYN